MKMLSFIFLVLFCVFSASGNVEETTTAITTTTVDPRAQWGYPAGYMPHCEGVEKYTTIPKDQLDYISLVVYGYGKRNRKFSYSKIKNIVNDPRVDFRRRQTVVLITGYLDGPDLVLPNLMGRVYERKGYNVLLLDVHRFITVHYYLSTRLTRPVAKHVGEMVAKMTEVGLDPKRTEFVGFSLGAHIMSLAAKSFQDISGRNISRVTLLGPSGPCFRNLGPDMRADKSHAEFVDIIHTNIDGYGSGMPVGHVDIYINGGEHQPSNLFYFPCTQFCAHMQVLLFWAVAVQNPYKFIAMKCDSIQQIRDYKCYDRKPRELNYMGLEVDKTKPGLYYLSTARDYPFYLAEEGLKPKYIAYKLISNVNDGNDTEIIT